MCNNRDPHRWRAFRRDKWVSLSGRPPMQRQKGTALVIILSAIVLISILVALFLSQAALSRQMSSTSAGSYRAELMARTGLDVIVGDLRDEIVAGSVTTTSNGVAIYRPITNFTAVPFRVGDQGLANVYKSSRGGSSFWSGANYSTSGPIRSMAGNSTTNLSANGRSIKADRWNAPYLLGTNLPPGFVAPDWVMVSRDGAFADASNLPAISVLKNSASGNTNYVIGRFSYVIYNEGGLLDATVAGFPENVDAAFKAKRGFMPQVDMSMIPGVINAAAIVQWRNGASTQTSGVYSNYVFNATNGFSSVMMGDQTFIGRQDLINYAKDHPTHLTLEALQYLGTSSVEVNGPSYSPKANRPKVASSQYNAYGQDDRYNPSLIDCRVLTSFTRYSDGAEAKVGEPLIKYRFPLSRLAAITHNAIADEDSDIYKFFGLSRTSTNDPWVYRDGTNRILKLDEVAALATPREPDFFELLQAGIMVGSLGQFNSEFYAKTKNFDANIYYQIIQIGANLIDQYDADSYPTIISFNDTDFAGIESLPYISRVFTIGYRFQSGANDASQQFPRIGAWYQPEVWNPHVGGLLADGPSRFRFRTVTDTLPSDPPSDKEALRAVYTEFDNNGANIRQKESTPWVDPTVTSPGIEFSLGSGGSGYDFIQPLIPSPARGATAEGVNDHVIDGGNDFLGICAGIITDAPLDPARVPIVRNTSIGPSHKGTVTHELQYWSGSRWITYNWMQSILQSSSAGSQALYLDDHKVSPLHAGYPLIAYNGHSDPRSGRFGSWLSDFTVDATMVPSASPSRYDSNKTIRPSATVGDTQVAPVASEGWTFSGAPAAIGLFSENTLSSRTRYTDPDGVLRPGDGGYATGSTLQGGYPLGMDASSKNFSRPVMLNRPFRSVSEMAYASRGMPWKHLDFFSKDSADAAVLDLFSVNQATPRVQHGRVDLNTRQAPVLEAVLSGAFLDNNTSGSLITLTGTEAKNLAKSLVNLTSGDGGPLEHRADLVTRWMPVIGAEFASVLNSVAKRRREAAIRAFGDMGNARTWNVMIDILAQSGRFGPAATDVNQFMVDGERRYWLHASIDRYTGEVVSYFLEPVYE